MSYLFNLSSRLKRAMKDRACDRCGLTISIDFFKCPHCDGLSEAEINAMLERKKLDGEQERNLGYKLALYACVVVIVLVFLKLLVF